MKNLKSIFILSLLFTLSACNEGNSTMGKNSVQEYTINTDEVSPRSKGGLEFLWQAPLNWHYRTPQNPMQLAIFIAPHKNDEYAENAHTVANVSLSYIEGSAGTISSNIKRWATQINIAQVNTENSSRIVKTKLGDIHFVKLQNNENKKSILAAIYQKPAGTLFIKMHGPLNTVEQQTQTFVTFVESIHNKVTTKK